MTFTVGHVEGGTHAGWRKVKQKPDYWFCECSPKPNARSIQPGYMTRCVKCGTERDPSRAVADLSVIRSTDA